MLALKHVSLLGIFHFFTPQLFSSVPDPTQSNTRESRAVINRICTSVVDQQRTSFRRTTFAPTPCCRRFFPDYCGTLRVDCRVIVLLSHDIVLAAEQRCETRSYGYARAKHCDMSAGRTPVWTVTVAAVLVCAELAVSSELPRSDTVLVPVPFGQLEKIRWLIDPDTMSSTCGQFKAYVTNRTVDRVRLMFLRCRVRPKISDRQRFFFFFLVCFPVASARCLRIRSPVVLSTSGWFR